MAKINNMPDYAKDFPYIVATVSEFDSEYWFYGAYEKASIAGRAAKDTLTGLVFEHDDIDWN